MNTVVIPVWKARWDRVGIRWLIEDESSFGKVVEGTRMCCGIEFGWYDGPVFGFSDELGPAVDSFGYSNSPMIYGGHDDREELYKRLGNHD